MRQRTGRRKFHDLRFLTFQDWIIPNCHKPQRKANEVMKNSRLPVFSYTKMDNGPPLSPISSQFAWAGHTLPDLVQEQSERLLKRLERPRTADNRDSHYKNSQMKGTKWMRPSTAAPLRNGTPPATRFHVNGTKYDASTGVLNEMPPLEMTESVLEPSTCPEAHSTPSPISERSSSPDFIANLYKEYEKKLASDHYPEMLSPSSQISPVNTPTTKLLRRPSAQLRLSKGTDRHKNSSSQTSPTRTENIVHCVVKLPSDQANLSVFSTSHSSQTPLKSETWLDLSELCQLSDEETLEKSCPEVVRLHRPSIVSDSGSSLKILDLLSEGDDFSRDAEMKKVKPHLTRPTSSKNLRKTRPKSRMKKRRPASAAHVEESSKEIKQASQKSPETKTRKGRNSDKLREEIETQMSKLDFDSSARERHDVLIRNLPPVRRTTREVAITPTSTHVSQLKRSTWKASPSNGCISNFKSSLPLNKVPIQILSDPFSSNVKRFENRK